MSEAAKRALIDAPSSTVGTRVGRISVIGPEVDSELYRAGIIGLNGGLTVSGSITRDRVVIEALDRAFQ